MGVMDLRRNIILNEPHIYTGTGNPVSFSTNMRGLLKECKVEFTPVQSGTGDPSPDNVRPITGWTGLTAYRTGKNLLAKSILLYESGTDPSSNEAFFVKAGDYRLTFDIESATKWRILILTKTLDGTSTGNDSSYKPKVTDNNMIWFTYCWVTGYDSSSKDVKITIPKDCQIRIMLGLGDTSESTVISNGMLELNETATAYAPYSGNSYPVTFPAVGKNLVHSTPYGGLLYNVQVGTDLAITTNRSSSVESGNTITVTVTHQWYAVVYSTDMLPPGTYNIHIETGDVHGRVSLYVADKDFIALSRTAITSNNKAITLTETSRIVVTLSNDNSEGGSVTFTNLQVESGSSYTSWEPYTNTVYGGSLDVTTGVLTVTHVFVDFSKYNVLAYGAGDGSLWFFNANYNPPLKMYGGNDLADAYCDKFTVATYNSFSRTVSKDNSIALDSAGRPRFRYNAISGNENKEAMYAVLADVTFIAPLATPLTYQLTPQEIKTLIGDNTIWSDTNGDITVQYWKH